MKSFAYSAYVVSQFNLKMSQKWAIVNTDGDPARRRNETAVCTNIEL
jgi:hypothetical protein